MTGQCFGEQLESIAMHVMIEIAKMVNFKVLRFCVACMPAEAECLASIFI
jgi:hypothetical protein